MDQPYSVRFSNKATKDLEAAVNWIKEDSFEAAEVFFAHMRHRCESNLSKTPRMGVTLRLPDGTELLTLTCGTYRIFYTVSEQGRCVIIIRILHTSRNIASILRVER